MAACSYTLTPWVYRAQNLLHWGTGDLGFLGFGLQKVGKIRNIVAKPCASAPSDPALGVVEIRGQRSMCGVVNVVWDEGVGVRTESVGPQRTGQGVQETRRPSDGAQPVIILVESEFLGYCGLAFEPPWPVGLLISDLPRTTGRSLGVMPQVI